ncbi:hypothetical protein [Candidatus Babela massiliensis]|uniref:Uncharacterized protein n=1 Tax=Candidatus Babela massiliensis TaxID=673862 RepID=V6DFE7_9BACT|nr:hypothetical protein [Candidatus Babela massiliensis]CDK30317.1 hypothetical protein BABL1_gene_701 [Candidatus Babela massiliensis]
MKRVLLTIVLFSIFSISAFTNTVQDKAEYNNLLIAIQDLKVNDVKRILSSELEFCKEQKDNLLKDINSIIKQCNKDINKLGSRSLLRIAFGFLIFKCGAGIAENLTYRLNLGIGLIAFGTSTYFSYKQIKKGWDNYDVLKRLRRAYDIKNMISKL